MSFHQQLALVTGAGSGIGRATALLLAQLGARVIITDRNSQSLQETQQQIQAQGGQAFCETVDVADWSAMQALAARIHQQYGVLDILVNNAGVATSGEFLKTPIEDWQWIMSINLMGVVHGCKAFGGVMAERKRGHIVNVASAAGYYAAPDMSAYSASKYAVMGLSESLRIELAEFNVGVSAICPGVINTNIVATMRTNGETVQAQAKIVDIYKKRNYGPEGVAEAIVSVPLCLES